MYLPIKEWDKKFLTYPIGKIVSGGKHNPSSQFFLPSNSVIHYIGETDQTVGIDNSYCLIRNGNSSPIYIYHMLHLKVGIGNVSSTNIPINNVIRRYQKTHLNIKPLTNLDRSLSNNSAPIVINYALLPRLNKYTNNTLVVYQEWYNIRLTMWDMINQIGGRREHFIRYLLPEILPTRSDLSKYTKNFTSNGLADFHTNESFDLLELWRIINPSIESVITKVSDEAIEHVNLVFVELNNTIIIRLKDLLDWSHEDPEVCMNSLYHFLDGIVALRTPNNPDIVDINDKDLGENDLVSNEVIVRKIKEAGEMGALSEAEQKGLLKLSQKYKTILDPHGSGKTLEEMAITDNDLTITDTKLLDESITIHDESMLHSTMKEFTSKYVTEVLPKDIIATVLNLHKGGVIVKDIKVKRKNNAVTKSDTYSVSLQPINGEASTIHFTIPAVNTDGTFVAGGIRYSLTSQRGELPIFKVKSNTVSLTSYYGKIFVTRNESVASNYSKWILKEIINRFTKNDGTIGNLLYGINKIKNLQLPRAYTAICEAITSFDCGRFLVDGIIRFQYHLDFAIEKKLHEYDHSLYEKIKDEDCVVVGELIGGLGLLGMDNEGTVYTFWGSGIRSTKADSIEELGTIPYLIDPSLGNGPIEYSEMSVFNRRIPLGLAFSYLFGLDEMLKKLQIPFTLSATNVRLAYHPDEVKLKFKDIVYVITVTKPADKLIVGGLLAIKNDISKYKGSDFNRPNIYSSLMSGLGVTNYHLRELKLMFDMWMEPITLNLLKEMGEPTDFYHLLLRANSLLVDDFVHDLNAVRYKGYERLSGLLYHQLITAMRTHRAGGSMSNVGVTINPKSVWLDIIQDQSVSLVEESNPLHNLKEHESFTHGGAGGRSAETMVKETRAYNEKDLGVISESTPDSAKVGIRAYFTANPNFVNLRGVTREFNHEKDGATNALSSTTLAGVSLSHDDSKRVNYKGIQDSHTVACNGYHPSHYRTGYEEVIGAKADDIFVVTAEEDGIVEDNKKDVLTVKYGKDRLVNYELGIYHGTVSGVTIPHTRISDLKKGHQFKKGDALVFNSGFFQRSEINPRNVVYKGSLICKVALVENMDVTEDGSVITSELASKLVTPTTTLHGVIVDFDTIIHNLVKIGDVVDPETILCTLEQAIGENVDAKDAAAIKALTAINANNPKAKVYGKVTDIEVVYYGKIDDMHFSLQKIAEYYDSNRAKRVKRYQLDEAKTGRIDETVRIAGKKVVENQLAIKIYIDGELPMNCGDYSF